MKKELTLQQKKERLEKLYPDACEVAEILGYYDGSNEEELKPLEEHEGKSTWVDKVYELAVNNGNFEEAINENKRFAL